MAITVLKSSGATLLIVFLPVLGLFFSFGLSQPLPLSSFSTKTIKVLPTTTSLSFGSSFVNNDTSVGYGPFLDLLIPTATTFVSASYLDIAVTPFSSTYTSTSCVTHPYQKANIVSNTLQVCSPAGFTFLSFKLPFISISPSTPAVTLQIKLNIANLSSVSQLQLRAGFAYASYDGPNDWADGVAEAFGTSKIALEPAVEESSLTFDKQTILFGPNETNNCAYTVTFSSGLVLVNGSFLLYLPCGVHFVGFTTQLPPFVTLDQPVGVSSYYFCILYP